MIEKEIESERGWSFSSLSCLFSSVEVRAEG
jgi:hypothetical protein